MEGWNTTGIFFMLLWCNCVIKKQIKTLIPYPSVSSVVLGNCWSEPSGLYIVFELKPTGDQLQVIICDRQGKLQLAIHFPCSGHYSRNVVLHASIQINDQPCNTWTAPVHQSRSRLWWIERRGSEWRTYTCDILIRHMNRRLHKEVSQKIYNKALFDQEKFILPMRIRL